MRFLPGKPVNLCFFLPSIRVGVLSLTLTVLLNSIDFLSLQLPLHITPISSASPCGSPRSLGLSRPRDLSASAPSLIPFLLFQFQPRYPSCRLNNLPKLLLEVPLPTASPSPRSLSPQVTPSRMPSFDFALAFRRDHPSRPNTNSIPLQTAPNSPPIMDKPTVLPLSSADPNFTSRNTTSKSS